MESSKRQRLRYSCSVSSSHSDASDNESSDDESSDNESSDNEVSADESPIEGWYASFGVSLVGPDILLENDDEINDVLALLRKRPADSSSASLDISDEMMSVDCGVSIANALKRNDPIIALQFRKRCICRHSIMTIVDALSDYQNTTLTKLAFWSNDIDYNAVVAMGHMLKTNDSLVDLSMDNCNINSAEAIVIGDVLKLNSTLKRLNLHMNSIGDVGIHAIASGVRENDSSSLNSLVLCHIDMGVKGAISIAEMLTTNKSLIELDLSLNYTIGAEGVIATVEALQNNQTLTMLQLGFTLLGDDGARSIASLLRTNASMQIVGLSQCIIGDSGAVAIAQALKTNKSLTELDLSYNNFDCNVIINELAPMLESNTTLKKLCLDTEDDYEPMIAARVLLRTLEDYNDTVDIVIVNADDDLHDELRSIISKIKVVSEENCQGSRTASCKHRRNIFNNLKWMWIARARDA